MKTLEACGRLKEEPQNQCGVRGWGLGVRVGWRFGWWSWVVDLGARLGFVRGVACLAVAQNPRFRTAPPRARLFPGLRVTAARLHFEGGSLAITEMRPKTQLFIYNQRLS